MMLRRPPGSRFEPFVAALCWVSFAAGCRSEKPENPIAERAEAPAPPPAPPPPPRPWYEGTWTAEAELVASAPQEGAGLPAEWTDEPTAALGTATITVTIDAERTARGSLEGPLSLRIRGSLDELVLRAELQSGPAGDAEAVAPAELTDKMDSGRELTAQERSFRGTLIAAPATGQSADGPTPLPAIPAPQELGDLPSPRVLKGTLRLSSGDSLLVRRADVSLSRTSTSPPSTSTH